MASDERFPDGVECYACGQSVSLLDGLEWPENSEEILCSWCEKELLDKLRKENEQLKQWVNDLQSGMYINCVYCGHRYGPNEDTPTSMADVLKEHVENCPKHPMSKLKKKYEALGNLSISGILHLKEEKKTLQNAQQRTRYTLKKTRENTQRILKLVKDAEESIELSLKYLKSYLKLFGYGAAGRIISDEYKQFRKEITEDQKLDERLLAGDDIFSWLVKKAITQLEGDSNAGSKVS